MTNYNKVRALDDQSVPWTTRQRARIASDPPQLLADMFGMNTHSSDWVHTEGNAGNASNALYTPWQTLTALAAETGQAIRHPFDSDVRTSGHVQQSLQHHASPSGDEPAYIDQPSGLNSTGSADAARPDVESTTAACQIDAAAVQTDIDRVQRKMMSTDAATQVTLRFNFLGGRESKVRQHHLIQAYKSKLAANNGCFEM